MNSVFLTHRAMLSGGVLVGIGALLAACGQQTANEASASTSSELRRVRPFRRLRRHLMRLLLPLLQARSLPTATPAAPKRPTANTVRPMATALPRMFLFPRLSRSSTPKPSLDSVR